MSFSALRSQLRTNIPGDTRISGRFNCNGSTLTVVEGTRYTLSKGATGLYQVRFGTSATDIVAVLGLVACSASAQVATPNATNSRCIVVNSVDTNASGQVIGFTLAAVDQGGALANMATDDDIHFQCILRDTEVRV